MPSLADSHHGREHDVAHILIVDDDEADRVLLRAILTLAGHKTREVSDGQDALTSLRELPVDVVVTDLQMPEVHGLELISLLRDLSPRPGIVAISGTGEPQLDIAQAVGADAVLTKPVADDQLLRAVRQALRAVGKEPE